MFRNPQRPLTRRQTARIVVAVSILAWATQTLVQQWGFGADVPPSSPPAAAPAPDALAAMLQNQTVERFVPPRDGAAPARLELRGEASVIGDDVKLRQVARWSEADAETFAPVADMVLFRLSRETPFKSVTLAEVKSTLHDAGVNLASIRFGGAARCVVSRVDVEYDQARALDQWINARTRDAETPASGPAAPAPEPAAPPAAVPLPGVAPVAAAVEVDEAAPTLRSMLLEDLAQRTRLPRESLQAAFKPADEKLLALGQPQFRFQVDNARARNLGDVVWNVTILTGDGSRQRATVTASARAWQTQLVAVGPIAARQLIRPEDVAERRTLIDRLGDDPMLRPDQAVGKQAARDLRAGTVLTAKMIDAVPLVRPGQFVTITLSQGGVQVKSVARALEGGAYGQTIRVKNETTREVFQVVINGPQTAAVGPVEVQTSSAAPAGVSAADR